GQHHVHDYDTSDYQEHGDDPDHRIGNHRSQIIPEFQNRSGRNDAEIVIFVGLQVMTRPHQHACLILGACHPLAAAALHVNVETFVLTIDLQESLNGD